nr:11707_t:CDS:2 [Entrophospora candida]CAG8619258.1 14036_t:CDS:2 [Entrophospora candida]
MSEEVETVVQTVESVEVVNKYQMAAEVSNRVLKKVIESAVDSAMIIDLCAMGDKLIDDGVKVLFSKAKNISKDPEGSDVLKNGDLVKIQLGAQVDGFAAIVASTFVVGATKEKPVEGKLADVLMAAHWASEAALRLIKPGLSNIKVTETIEKIAKAYGTNSVEGMLSYQQEKNIIEGKKQIILNPSDFQKREHETVEFSENEVYGVDILISTGEGKPKPSNKRVTVYKKTGNTYLLKMKTARLIFNEISQKFGPFPFPLRALEDEKKARMGILECSSHSLVSPYEVYQDKEGEFVAQFFNTVLLTKNGSIKITNTLFNPEAIKSDKKIEDEEILKLLATNLKPSKKKSKKKKAGSGDHGEVVAAEDGKETSAAQS